MNKPIIFILGKLPPPYYGPAISTKILLDSALNEKFDLVHIDIKLNADLEMMGKTTLRKMFRIVRLYITFVKKLFVNRPDLILVPVGQTTPAFLKDAVFILIGRIRGSRVLIQLHGSNWLNWLGKVNFITRLFVRQILQLTRGVIVLGNNLRYLFENYFAAERIFVVPNGADYILPRRNSYRDGVSMLYLANHFPGKGIDIVLKAMLYFKENYEYRFSLEVIGSWCDAAFENYCKEFVQINSLPVTFFDSKSGEDKLLSLVNSDVFVFPPKTPEGHPWVIVEALAAGLPIISTNQGAIVESVIDDYNGFIVESGNHIQIAEKIAYLVSHPEIREEMGQRSRRHYVENFTEAVMVDKLSYAINKSLD
jgi:glycosyltransferase involved in cell wall biosynthesis